MAEIFCGVATEGTTAFLVRVAATLYSQLRMVA